MYAGGATCRVRFWRMVKPLCVLVTEPAGICLNGRDVFYWLSLSSSCVRRYVGACVCARDPRYMCHMRWWTGQKWCILCLRDEFPSHVILLDNPPFFPSPSVHRLSGSVYTVDYCRNIIDSVESLEFLVTWIRNHPPAGLPGVPLEESVPLIMDVIEFNFFFNVSG